MEFHDASLVQKARLLRQKGLSLRQIETKLHIPSSTLSRWARDITSKNSQYHSARLFEDKNKKMYQQKINDLKIDKYLSKMLASILYWCEGSKYPASNRIAFTNSDPTMMKTFITLLRKAFPIQEEKLRVRLQLHSTHIELKENLYWSKLLHIPMHHFGKPTITNPTNKMKRSNYHGTCTIKYYDVKLQLQIMGLYEAFAEKFYQGGVR